MNFSQRKMATSRFLLSFALILVLFYDVAISVSDSNDDTDLVHQVCKKTLYHDVCLSSLGSDPTSKTADLTNLAILSVKLSLAHAKDTYTKIDQLQKSTSDPVLQQCLSDCSDEFQDVIDQLGETIPAISSKQYENVNTWVTAAMSDMQSCEDGFKEKKIKSPLENRDSVFFKMCSNTLAITKLLG